MKNISLIVSLLIMVNLDAQMNNTDIVNMEKFNIDKYKDWEVDSSIVSNFSNINYLKKGNKRVTIYSWDTEIQTLERDIILPYVVKKSYYPNSSLQRIHTEFYQVAIGKSKVYDELGRKIKEKDNDLGYDFSINDLILKIKREYSIDLEDRRNNSYIDRKEFNGKTYYEVFLKSDQHDFRKEYILINGKTGKTLYISYIYIKQERDIHPFDKYKEELKNENVPYRTHNGKSYTEEEWKTYEEQQYQEYLKKKNGKSFWDKLFGD